jgi:hypothetical protein
VPANAQSFAYFAGSECAVDRLLLGGEAERAKVIAEWSHPSFRLAEARLSIAVWNPVPSLQRRCNRSSAGGWRRAFPAGADFEQLVAEELASARG